MLRVQANELRTSVRISTGGVGVVVEPQALFDALAALGIKDGATFLCLNCQEPWPRVVEDDGLCPLCANKYLADMRAAGLPLCPDCGDPLPYEGSSCVGRCMTRARGEYEG